MTDVTLTRAWVVDDVVTRSDASNRVVELVAVPYNTPAEVSDGGPVYLEGFRPGAFADQLGTEGAAGRVDLRWSHQNDLLAYLGRGVTAVEYPDHLRAVFKVFDSPVGDHALAMLRDTPDFGVSVGYRPLRSEQAEDGVVWRTQAMLREVSLTPSPAYTDARVLAVRNGHLVAEPALEVGPPALTTDPDTLNALAKLEMLAGAVHTEG